MLVIATFSFVLCSIVAKADQESLGKTLPSDELIYSFLDDSHTYLQGKIKGPTIWFDNFFGDPRVEDSEIPTSFIRFRAVSRYTEGEKLTFPVRFLANLTLPKVNQRLHLIFFGGNSQDAQQERSGDEIDSTLQEDGNIEDRTNLGLRYVFFDSLRSWFHFGGGVRLGWPVDYYGRMHYGRVLHRGKLNVIRFTEVVFWKSQAGFGETSRLDLERILSEKITGRLSFYGTFVENKDGLQWGTEVNLFRPFSPKAAMALDLGMYGVEKPSFKAIKYRLAIRYRQNIFRRWLFYEIEPEVNYYPGADHPDHTVGIITLVLEFQFVS